MTEEGRTPWVARQMEGINLWAVLAGIGAIYGGYVTGTKADDQNAKDIAKLQQQVEDILPRVLTLEVQAETERDERMKGDQK